MSRRKKIIIIAAIVLGIFLIVFLVISLKDRAPLFNKNTNEVPEIIGGNINSSDSLRVSANINTSPPILTKEPATQSSLIAVSMTFAERFGSFSNEGNFDNLKDLKVMMTQKMQIWADNYIAENIGKEEVFYGVTTRALSAEIIKLAEDDSSAQVLVSTQREETVSGSSNLFVRYQKLLISLIQDNGKWKVDSADWK